MFSSYTFTCSRTNRKNEKKINKNKLENNHTVCVWHTLIISPFHAPPKENAIPTKSSNYPNQSHHDENVIEGIKATKNSFSLQSHLWRVPARVAVLCGIVKSKIFWCSEFEFVRKSPIHLNLKEFLFRIENLYFAIFIIIEIEMDRSHLFFLYGISFWWVNEKWLTFGNCCTFIYKFLYFEGKSEWKKTQSELSYDGLSFLPLSWKLYFFLFVKSVCYYYWQWKWLVHSLKLYFGKQHLTWLYNIGWC